LHYDNPRLQWSIEEMIGRLGECIRVSTFGSAVCTYPERGTVYLVPRHFIALHGIKAWELEELAERYGWTKVPEEEEA
jgi:hypothetical protein